jgi:hypothetical protein
MKWGEGGAFSSLKQFLLLYIFNFSTLEIKKCGKVVTDSRRSSVPTAIQK